MDFIFELIFDGIRFLYFKMKNNKRAKAFGAFAEKNGLTFNAKTAEYNGEIMQMQTPSAADLKSQGKKRLSRKARRANQYFGSSHFQAKLWAFNSNRYRGDWQANCNIMEGQWKGHLMTTFDTLWYGGQSGGDDEGEYSSVFAHCKGHVPQVMITPRGMLAAVKRLDEGQLLNAGYSQQKFEMDAFNKSWRVSSVDHRLTSDFISQNMIEYLMDHKGEKWHIELSPGGVLISTVYTLSPAKVELAMDFLAGLLEHVDEDLLRAVEAK